MSDEKNLNKIDKDSKLENMSDISEFPQPDSADKFYNFFVILLGIAGQVSGKLLNSPADFPLANLFTAKYEPPVIRRRNEFLKILAEKFENLRREHVEVKEVFDNPERLVTLLTHALPIAVKNHRKEKINALANVICNVYGSEHAYASDEIRDNTELIMLELIDRLTTSHIYVIKFLSKYRNANDRDESYALEDEFKEFYKNNSSLINYILHELEILGLIYEQEKPREKFQPSIMGRWITDPNTGEGRTQTDEEQFLEFQMRQQNTIQIFPTGILAVIYEKKLTDFCSSFLAYISDFETANKSNQ